MSNPFQSPQPPGNQPAGNPFAGNYSPPPTQQPESDATGGIIPYKNPLALIGYYVSIFTLLCCITPLPLGIIPVVLGVMGLREKAKNPHARGTVHAWIAIILGGLSALCSLVALVFVIIALLNQP